MLLHLADALIAHCRWPMILGLVLLGTERAFGVGGLTGYALMALGTFGACFGRWRTEPGLWMLSALFLPIFGIPWLLLGVRAVLDLPGPAPPATADPSMDCALCVSLLGLLAVFLATVASVNRGLKDPRKPRPLDDL